MATPFAQELFQKPLARLALSLVIVSSLLTANNVAADVIDFRAAGAGGEGLLGTNIDPPTGEVGTGGIRSGISFDTNTNLLTVDVGWGSGNGFTDMSADVLRVHLHGPTESSGTDAFGQRAPLILVLSSSTSFSASASSGGLNDRFLLDPEDADALLAGRTYINVHMTDTDTGVIRGYLRAVPEPGTLGVLAAFCLPALLARRRRFEKVH